MFMSVVDDETSVTIDPELSGRRVLITGLSAAGGIDIARAFADQGCRIVVQADAETPEVVAIAELLSQSDGEIRLFTQPLEDGEAAVRFAQTAAQSFGGLEIVVNLVTFAPADLEGRTSLAQIEDLVSRKLMPMTLLTRVAANRMRLTLTEGLLLNIVLLPEATSAAGRAMAGIIRAAIAALTRGEAQSWAGEALRINAIAPPALLEPSAGACLIGEADIAALALHLAGRRGKRLSGLVFDASGVAANGC